MTHMVRKLEASDFDNLITLYQELMGKLPVADGQTGRAILDELLAFPGTELLGAEHEGLIASVATLHVIPNLTHGGRPYALIENVVTRSAMQGQGLGRAVMQAAIEKAWAQNAYKIMLLTGKTAQARGFYEKLGFVADEKWGMTLRRVPKRLT